MNALWSATVMRLEAGGRPRVRTVVKLARALDVSMDSLLRAPDVDAAVTRLRVQLDAWGI